MLAQPCIYVPPFCTLAPHEGLPFPIGAAVGGGSDTPAPTWRWCWWPPPAPRGSVPQESLQVRASPEFPVGSISPGRLPLVPRWGRCRQHELTRTASTHVECRSGSLNPDRVQAASFDDRISYDRVASVPSPKARNPKYFIDIGIVATSDWSSVDCCY